MKIFLVAAPLLAVALLLNACIATLAPSSGAASLELIDTRHYVRVISSKESASSITSFMAKPTLKSSSVMTSAGVPDNTLIPSSTITSLPTDATIGLNYNFHNGDINDGPTAKHTMPPATTDAPGEQGSLTVQCKECSTNGTVVVTPGAWDISSNGMLQNGSITITVQNFTAQLGLSLEGSKSGFMAYELVGDVPIPGAGLVLPHIGKAGLMVHPEIFVQWDFNDLDVAFDNYGFHFEIPSDAQIHIDFVTFNRSSVTGFSPVHITMLDPNSHDSNITELNMNLSIGMRLNIIVALGLDILGGEAEAGIYLDLPVVSATGRSLPSTDFSTACGVPADAATDELTSLYKSLVRLESGIAMNAGLELAFDLPFIDRTNYTTAWKVVDETMGSGCFAYDAANKVLVNATDKLVSIRQDQAAKANATSQGGSGGGGGGDCGGKKGGAVAVSPALSGALGALVVVGFAFCFL